MHSTSLLSAVLFSAVTFAQANDYNFNEAEASKVNSDANNFITALESNPAFQSDAAVLLTDLPASIIDEAGNDPGAFLDALAAASTTPTWVSAIPTPVIESIESLTAEPLDAEADVDLYVASLIEEPGASSVISVLVTNVPTSVQNAFASDPVSFLDNLITASPLPTWASNVPAPLQSDLGSVINEALSVIDLDYDGSAPNATVPPSAFSTGGYYPPGGYSPSSGFYPTVGIVTGGYYPPGGSSPPSAFYPTVGIVKPTGGYYPPGGNSPPSGFYPTVVIVKPTGTGSVLAFNGKATGSPIAFEGAAAPMKTAAAGAAALLVGAGIFANF